MKKNILSNQHRFLIESSLSFIEFKRMRKSILISFLLIFPTVSAQLNQPNNAFRAGDVIIKQQVTYKDPGRTGINVVWDFSMLEDINPEYTLTYTYPPILNDSAYVMGSDTIPTVSIQEGELIVGTEHLTMYYYRQQNDSLLLLGYENPTTLMQHTQPVLQTIFPFTYGQKAESSFFSEGSYSAGIPLKQEGKVRLHADATGVMILPSKDTLRNVLRVKSVQDFLLTDTTYSYSLKNRLHLQMENCKWYAEGYRYPVFETIRSMHPGEENEIFSTAFFYPPQEHHYLFDDEDNMKVLALLYNNDIAPFDPFTADNSEKTDIITYNYYPNPVRDYMYVEFHLDSPADLSIAVFDIFGMKMLSVPEQHYDAGIHSIQFQTGTLPTANYILKFILLDRVVSTPFVKL